jgi:hypothetical protein
MKFFLTLLKFFEKHPFQVYLSLVLSVLIIYSIYLYATAFKKSVTITQKNQYAQGKYMNNTVIDENGNVYAVTNLLPVLHFRAPEVWNTITIGKTYTVKGYGIRIPILGMYPIIVSTQA